MNKNLFTILMLIGIVVYACSDIFEEDIEDETVVLLAPADLMETDILTHTFWWEEVDDALKYNLQIVSPTFDDILKLELDTNVTTNMFEHQLNPGSYQWRVKAFNGSSETGYTVFSLKIDSTLTLANQSVSLLFPLNDAALSNLNINFQWRKIDIANEYTLRVKLDEWDSGDIVIDEDLFTTNLDTVLNEGKYSWGVRASNDNSVSIYKPKTFIIDTTSPGVPSLSNPVDNYESTTGEITFTWDRDDDGGSDITDRILIASDTTFTTDKLEEDCTVKEYKWKISITETKDYYWKVIAIDRAGNTSTYSERRKLTLKNAK